jgi:hypothetical protein
VPCTCSHARDAHDHYRPGTDCSGCSCRRYLNPYRVVGIGAAIAVLLVLALLLI